ncbi:putative sulfate exporter family transporter [Leuconostocaceae bacterium ESL0958]|nr:putative sulfate exporter family transporter [Leuconostocaceae bacterium ESL0958]
MRIQKEQYSGIVLAFLVALVGLILGHYWPSLGPETLAMLVGIILGNTLFQNSRYGSGVKWAEKYPIEMAIALLGFNLTFQTIARLKVAGVALIVINMVLVITLVYWLGKKLFHTSQEESLLMAAGNAVCGSSAIAAVAPAIQANDEKRRTAVATVSLTGMVLVLTLPALVKVLFPGQNLVSGALIGATVQSVGQVVGAGSLVNASVATYATLFKLLRVLLLVVVVFVFQKIADKSSSAQEQQAASGKAKWFNLPWYITALLILLVINTCFLVPSPVKTGAHNVTSFFGVVNLAAIGLNLKWATIKKSGLRFLSYGLLVGCCQVLLALALIYLLY